jgi:hypothetical protein
MEALEKLIVARLLNNFPAFYGTQRFITAIARTQHCAIFYTV